MEDVVIRMRDQEDCFSKEEFKELLRARFYEIAGVVVVAPGDVTHRILIVIWIPVWFIFSGGLVFRQTGDADILKGVGTMLAVWLCCVALLFSGKGIERRAMRRISGTTRRRAVEALVGENLITEKQDKALRLLIAEAEKRDRFVWKK